MIADIGCGRGGTTVRLAARFPAARLLPIDTSPAMVTATRARTTADLHRISGAVGDFHALPLRDNSCDLAVAVFCLYHSRLIERSGLAAAIWFGDSWHDNYLTQPNVG
ncbi:class I SAM-dependent methyltransferase [Actinomadura alba]|uniref:class I SAM-dependent methyltransferase n=1 Tax=Actinomadura alba TaxID=406431 RepID=UPI0028B019F0|nr:class I SAM-dependent methyltransferase [Actinomadura alba]